MTKASAPSRSGNKKEAPVRDGYIVDIISGKEIRATPEEISSVQVFAQQLLEDYGYPRSHIRTNPQWRVRRSPSDKKGSYPIDIGVFSSRHHSDDTLSIIVECKQPNRKDGEDQLKSYLSLSNARIGVWFNGRERFFLRKIVTSSGVKFEHIPNIPKHGQRVEDIGRFIRKDLKKTHNLKSIFQVIRNNLAGNAVGTTRDEELARQLINLVFCKIWDEKFTAPDDQVSFRAGIDETPKDIKERIQKLFSKVKEKYKEILDITDTINLDEKSIAYVVGELQNYCIIETERDVVADAFETFIGYALKGSQGQFFTPRNVVQLMTKIAAPTRDQLILDPACGSGGFLVESLRTVWSSIEKMGEKNAWGAEAIHEERLAVAMQNIFGIEKDSFLAKVAKAYMAIIGDGKGGIYCEDSLELPANWKEKTRQQISLGKFDLILTNPPFGKNIKVTGADKLRQYQLAHQFKTEDGKLIQTSKLKDDVQPDILFVERCMQLLKDGGKLGIILPETFFHAPRAEYVRKFMERHNIFFILDLPHNTFRPHNNAKCIAVFIQKNRKQQKNIKMAVAEEMGHDHNGKEIYRWNPIHQRVDRTNLWDDIPLIEKELESDKQSKYTFSVPATECAENGIYVPRFYWQKKEEEIARIAKSQGFKLVSIQELIDSGALSHFDGHGSPESENKGNGEIPYIRVKDIVNWEVYHDPTSKIPEDIYREMTEKKETDGDRVIIRRPKELKPKDILYVRRGSYRIGSVAMVSKYDTKALLTREITVLRVADNNDYGLTPHYLLYALSHFITQMQTRNKVLIETTLPNIGDRWKSLQIPIPEDAQRKRRISGRIERIIDSKWAALDGIARLRADLGDIVT